MKKIKYKRKSKKNIFSTKSILLLLMITIICFASAYALYTESLIMQGNVSGDLIYTYYFKKPSTWTNSSTYAYIWYDNGSTTTSSKSWPGYSMSKVTGTTDIYKIEFDSSTNLFSTHNYIIFNNGSGSGNQTSDIPITPSRVNNKLFTVGSYSSSTNQRLSFTNSSGWNKVYAYLWSDSTTSNAAWPGVEITSDKISSQTYYIEVPKNRYKYIIFNNGLENSALKQTADLPLPPDGDMLYSGNNAVLHSGAYKYSGVLDNYWTSYSGSKKRVLFYNSYGWSTIRIHLYDDNGNTYSSWPGTNITANKLEKNVYYFDIDPSWTYTHFLFNNGSRW